MRKREKRRERNIKTERNLFGDRATEYRKETRRKGRERERGGR